MNKDFEVFKNEYRKSFERFLEDFLLEQKQASVCTEMALYHLRSGGKRLRGVIPCYIYFLAGKDPQEAFPLGAAVEFIHNATLVHDDLQDGDEFRRGQPAVWKKYSTEQAINCGDAFFQYAGLVLQRLKTNPEFFMKILDLVFSATLQVIEGQAQEFLIKDVKNLTLNQYLKIVEGKTSSLFMFAFVSPLLALGADPIDIEKAKEFSRDFGLAFQIQDDLSDGLFKKHQIELDVPKVLQEIQNKWLNQSFFKRAAFAQFFL